MRPSRSSSATAAGWRARSGACACRSSARGPPPSGAAAAQALADDLGVALQLTNILRDVREDAENGRVYLPGEDLRRFGLADGTPLAGLPERLAGLDLARARGAPNGRSGELEDLCSLVRFEADRAESVVRARDAAGAAAGPPQRAPACGRWPGSTTACSSGSRPSPRGCCASGSRCPTREKAWVAARALAGAAS